MNLAAKPNAAAFAPARGRRAFDDIVLQIRTGLKSGELAPGDRLPSERELSEQFQVSRNTVREALRMLEIAGLVVIRKGATGGTFVAEGNPSIVSQTLSDMLTLTQFSFSDLTEVRLWLGSITARVACDRGTEEDFDRLAANLELAAELTREGRWDERAEANHEFQNLLAAATGNPVLIMVQRSITNLIRDIVFALGATRDPRIFDSKRRLVEALRGRDADRAVEEMETHLRLIHAIWLDGIE